MDRLISEQADGEYQTDKDCYNCGQPRDYKGRCIPYKEGNCNKYSEWMPKQTDGASRENDVTTFKDDVLNAISRIGLFKSDTKEVQAVAECLRAVEALPPVKPQPCEDAISRQALQEWIKDKSFGDIVVASEHNFDCLPSVKPQEPINLRQVNLDCRYSYFDADDKHEILYCRKDDCECDLKVIPSAEPIYYPPCEDCHKKMNETRKTYDKIQSAESKMGHWIDADGDNAICDCCNRLNHLYGTYCKHCGAKMIER